MVAGDGGEAMVEPACQGLRAVLGREIVGEVAQQPREIALSDQRRRLAHQHGAGAEGLDDEAERCKFLRMRLDQRRRVGVEIDDERRQQHLPLDPALLALALQASRRRSARARRAGRR